MRPPTHPALLAALALAAAPAGAAPPPCSAQARGVPPRVVELYTSEGCNSCPPADRWLSGLKGRGDVIAAAFHVDYWDRLGWRDRFASPAHTARQATLQATSGVRYSYTPQVLVDGRDWRAWPELPTAQGSSGVQLGISRHGDQAQLTISTDTTSPPRLTLWWALLEDGHESAVRAGENAGARLRHDHVVRHHGQLPPWNAAGPSKAFTVQLPQPGEGARAARLLAVVQDATSGRTLQAVQLGPCPPAPPLS